MRKVKLYDPIKNNTKNNSFFMQFGFEQPMPIKYKTKRQ